MPQPPSEPQHVAWQGDPARDFLIYLLIRLARGALIEHFEADDAEETYVKWHASAGRRGRRSDKPRELQRWNDAAGCSVTLTALPEQNKFVMAASDDSFQAEVRATFDPSIAELENATVTSFAGNSEDAADAIETRLNEWLEAGELDLDLEDLFGPDNDDDLDFEADDDAAESAPPDMTPADLELVRRMARRVGRRFADDKAPDLTDQDRDWLESTPQSLWALLDSTLEVARKQPHDDALLAAWRFLLSRQLELIRFRADGDWEWAREMLEAYQNRLVALAQEGKTDGETLFLLVAALNQAKVPVRSDVGEAIVQSDTGAAALPQSPQALAAGMHAVIDELASLVGTPFETAEALQELTSIAPPEMRAFLAHELALSPHVTLRDAVPLMLLDERSEVRRSAAAALEQIAVPETLSPEALRRTIALRNWIPEADRAAVDQAIRKARTKGVTIAQWRTPGELAFHASPIDGAGAQSLLAASRSGRTGVFCGVLAKQEFGIRDAWSNTDMPRRQIASGLAEVQRSIASPEVTRDYFDVSVQHHIAVGLAHGNLPGHALLEVAETIGAADWKDRRIDPAAETQQLFDALPAAERGAEAIAAALRRTGVWAQRDRMAESWFADDAEARDVIGEFKGRDTKGAAHALLDGVLEKQRPVWAERCLLMALWARAINSGHKDPSWQDFLLLAHALYGARKLAEIPLMTQVAEHSVAAAKGRAW
jgi:hypothetical protein